MRYGMLFLFLPCGFALCGAQALPPSPTPTLSVSSVPGQAELEEAQAVYLKKGAKEAKAWFEKARSLGNAEAALDLYVIYDFKYRVKYFDFDPSRLASDLSYQRYGKNEKTPEIYRRLLRMTRKAAQQGSPMMQLALGRFYFRGDLLLKIKPDVVEALKWYREAAGQGNAEAEWQMGTFYDPECKDCAAMGLPPSEEAQKYWYRRSALHGCQDAAQLMERWDTEDTTVSGNGLLTGAAFRGIEGKRIILDHPITLAGRGWSIIGIDPTQEYKGMADYVKIRGTIHWCGSSKNYPAVEVEKIQYINDHGKHLVDYLLKREHRPGVVLLKFKEDATESVKARILSGMGEAHPLAVHLLQNAFSIKLKKGLSLKAALEKLVNEPSVIYAEPDAVYHLQR